MYIGNNFVEPGNNAHQNVFEDQCSCYRSKMDPWNSDRSRPHWDLFPSCEAMHVQFNIGLIASCISAVFLSAQRDNSSIQRERHQISNPPPEYCIRKINAFWNKIKAHQKRKISSSLNSQGAVSIRKTVLPGMAIPMLKIRRPNGRLIFNMEIAIRR